MEDLVKEFFDHFIKGDLVLAINQILPSPDFSYEQLQSPSNLLQPLVNYVDASLFGNLAEFSFQNALLKNFIEMETSKAEVYHEIIEILKAQENFFFQLDDPLAHSSLFFQVLQTTEKEKRLLDNFEIEHLLKEVPKQFKSFTEFHLMMAWGWQKLKQNRPQFLNNFSKEFYEIHPWYPLQYSLPIPSLKNDSNTIPVIFFEPIQDDLSLFFDALKGNPAVFALTTVSSFFQMLQFPAFADSLCDEEHLTYILELYPNQQFVNQKYEKINPENLYPIFFAPTEHMQAYSPSLLLALKECLSTSRNKLNFDTLEGNWLYEISKRLLRSIQQNRLGRQRAPALYMYLEQKKWYDKHQGPIPQDKLLGPEVHDPMKSLLSDLSIKRAVRARVEKDRVVLAHIVPQIVYGGHAPTRLLENLVLHHDQQKFEVLVISTELLQELPLEYPHNFYTSPSSEDRGGPIC